MTALTCRGTAALVLTVGLSALAGCGSLGRAGRGDALTGPQPVRPLTLTYRTGSDRLNVASGAWARGGQFVSHGRPPGALLPNMTVAELTIQSPHPAGHPGYALATVAFRPPTRRASGGKTFWKRLLPWSGKPSDGDRAAWTSQETWALDIPQWQLETIVSKLREARFFRRERVLSPNAYLEVAEGDARFGKRYKAIPELDSLILRTHSVGRPLQAPPAYGSPAGPGSIAVRLPAPLHPADPSWPPSPPSTRPIQ